MLKGSSFIDTVGIFTFSGSLNFGIKSGVGGETGWEFDLLGDVTGDGIVVSGCNTFA